MKYGRTTNLILGMAGELYGLCQVGVNVPLEALDVDMCYLLLRIHGMVNEEMSDR